MTEIKITNITDNYVDGVMSGNKFNIPIRFNGQSVNLITPKGASVNPKIMNVYKGVNLQNVLVDIKLDDMMGVCVIRGNIKNSKHSDTVIPVDQIKAMACDRFDPHCQEWSVYL